MVNKNHQRLSMTRQCELLGINRSSLYYNPKGESEMNKNLKDEILKEYEKHPFLGVPRMYRWLRDTKGYQVNKKRIERLFKDLGLKAIFPKRNLSKPDKGHRKYPYLLHGLEITRPNHVWQTDISYILLPTGVMYLTAVIDVFSRRVLNWDVSNSMSAKWCKGVMEKAVGDFGKPKIVNTDQGSQYTSELFLSYLESIDVQISMDGKGRALDNIYIERLWRSVKYEDIYLKSYEDGLSLWQGLREYFKYYNYSRGHQALNYQPPASVYIDNKKQQVA